MSKRSGRGKQEGIRIAHTELAVAPGHPFYEQLNELLEGAGFDEFVEARVLGCWRVAHPFGQSIVTTGRRGVGLTGVHPKSETPRYLCP
jgi:hypothetical protein